MNKKKALMVAGVAALVLIATASFVLARDGGQGQQAATNQKCAIGIESLVLKDAEGSLKTDQEIVTAVFNHYFEGYQQIPDCPTAALKGHRIVSIGETKRDGDHILADIVFDLEPTNTEKTEWITPETTVEAGWVKNKKGQLSIQKSGDTYYLII